MLAQLLLLARHPHRSRKRFMTHKPNLVAASLLALASLAAQADVLTFEGVPNNFSTTFAVESFTFSFNASGWGVASAAFWSSGSYNNNGTAMIGLAGTRGSVPGQFNMRQTDGSTFSLQAFDVADLFRGTADNNVNVTGHLLGGGTVSASCVADNSFDTCSVFGFDNLTSVDFAQSTMAGWPATGTGLSIDNIVFNAPTDGHVPEPASLALVGLAALGAGLARRRKA